jgi:carbon starvation protein
MARIFGRITGGRWMDLWYHFAIMFEALFILTTLDAGTRVGRFMLQDMLGHVWAPLKRVSWGPGVIFTSLLMVGAWGWFLWGGVTDPNGGINSLWPLFGIANQMLASIALCVATAILIKMGRGALALVAGLPLLWLLVTTQTATFEKVWSPSPRIGFLTQARAFDAQAEAETDPTEVARARQLAFNARLNAGMAILFAVLAWIVLLDGARVCWLNRKRGLFPLQEAPWQASRLTT